MKTPFAIFSIISRPCFFLGISVALCIFLLDQGHKFWALHIYEIAHHQPLPLLPFLDMVLAWNKGISYSLLQTSSDLGRYGFMTFSLLVSLFLTIWLSRVQTKHLSLALGLLIGGAVSNALDRWIYGAVADFFYFHVETEKFGLLSWYIFNLADVGIVVGTGLLIYDALWPVKSSVREPHPQILFSSARSSSKKLRKPPSDV